jgi:hypothetical protein
MSTILLLPFSLSTQRLLKTIPFTKWLSASIMRKWWKPWKDTNNMEMSILMG